MKYFKGKQFKKDIILVVVGYYCRFSLSYRNVSELLKERGISVHPTTIMRWVHDCCSLMYQNWKKKNKFTHPVWHFDETYIKVKGEWRYFYCAIDRGGDIQICKTRDHKATYSFMRRLIKTFGGPTVLTTDQAPALLCAFKKTQKYGYYIHIKHCTIQHRNNFIEQDHRYIKRPFSKSAGFQSLRHASCTLKEIETIHALYKRKRSLQTNCVFSTYNELQQLFIIA
ncbi:IS6 family transposase [Bacillus cereus]|uniref:IS6 family transposase n=1 Tax=Bacillus cereus TaxID=1396 RepID=UPI003D11BC4B